MICTVQRGSRLNESLQIEFTRELFIDVRYARSGFDTDVQLDVHAGCRDAYLPSAHTVNLLVGVDLGRMVAERLQKSRLTVFLDHPTVRTVDGVRMTFVLFLFDLVFILFTGRDGEMFSLFVRLRRCER